jgi:hypothetical protein
MIWQGHAQRARQDPYYERKGGASTPPFCLRIFLSQKTNRHKKITPVYGFIHPACLNIELRDK